MLKSECAIWYIYTSNPPPRHEPLIAATTGFVLFSSFCIMDWPLIDIARNYACVCVCVTFLLAVQTAFMYKYEVSTCKLTSSFEFAESNQAMSAPAMKQPGFEEIRTAALASLLASTPSITYTQTHTWY